MEKNAKKHPIRTKVILNYVNDLFIYNNWNFYINNSVNCFL